MYLGIRRRPVSAAVNTPEFKPPQHTRAACCSSALSANWHLFPDYWFIHFPMVPNSILLWRSACTLYSPGMCGYRPAARRRHFPTNRHHEPTTLPSARTVHAYPACTRTCMAGPAHCPACMSMAHSPWRMSVPHAAKARLFGCACGHVAPVVEQVTARVEGRYWGESCQGEGTNENEHG